MTKSIRPQLIAGTAFLSAALFLGAGAAFAQAAPANNDQASEDTTEIVVTGTRITNPNLVSATKVLSIGTQEIADRQAVAAEELLRQLPGIVPSTGPQVNNGNNGAQTIDLRGLGTNRNLVLLDSHRVVPFGLTGVVDTNVIPLSLIERVDVVTGGASSAYGADAITGVVNFITKRNFVGVEATNSVRVTERGDGLTYRSEVALGADLADGKGNVSLGLGYQNSNPVLQGNRAFSAESLGNDGAPGGSSTAVPTNVVGRGLSGAIDPVTGVITGTRSNFNFAPLNVFQTPVERFNIFAQGHYEIAPKVEFFSQAFFTRSNVRQQIAPTGTFTNTYQLPLSNPFLPTAARNQICAAFGITQAQCDAAAATTVSSDPNYREVGIGLRRRFVEQGPRFTDFVSNRLLKNL